MTRAFLISVLLVLAACAEVAPALPVNTPVAATATASSTPTSTPKPTMTASPTPIPIPTPTALNNGYFWHGHWIPGVVSFKTQQLSTPSLIVGVADSYGPGMMELVADNTGRYYGSEYVGAVALMLCSDVGSSVWLQRPGGDFEGPFYVMDCSRPVDLYGIIVYSGIVVEVDYNTAVRWGTFVVPGVVVSKLPPGQINGEPVNFRSWFLSNVTFEP